MKNLPDKIYLQIGEDINIDSNTDFNTLEEVTWCKDKINNNDIVYIRADLKQLSEETRKDFEKENCVTLNGEIYKQIKANDNPEKPHHH